MSKNELKTIVNVKPIFCHRFLIGLGEIPSELFRKYEIYNVADKVYMDTEFIQTEDYKSNLFDLFKLEDIKISYLNEFGEIIKTQEFFITGLNFKEKFDYASGKLSTVKLKLIIENKIKKQ